MIELRLLGSLDLRNGDGWELRSVLAQPKRLALLAYLALRAARGWERRDILIEVFWPELDGEHARTALRQALYQLRSSLGADVVETRGDELRLAACRVRCDALELERLACAGDLERAIALYRGELLPGLHVSGAPDFGRWAQAERERLRRLVTRCALTCSERSDDRAAAVFWARRALEISPAEEEVARRLMTTLAANGDRAAALRVFGDLCEALDRELRTEPSPETHRLVATLRNGSTSPAVSVGPARLRSFDPAEPHGTGTLPFSLTVGAEADAVEVALAAASLGRDVERFLHGEALRSAGRPAEAVEWYAAVAGEPRCSDALLAAARWRHAEALDLLGRPREAEEELRGFLHHWNRCEKAVSPLAAAAERRLRGTRAAGAAESTSAPEGQRRTSSTRRLL